MATPDRASNRLRCLSCGAVDVPATLRGGPGWLAVGLWALTLVAWAVSWYVVQSWVTWGIFWLALFVTLIYTLWYFYKRERACRSCGSRRLEAEQPA